MDDHHYGAGRPRYEDTDVYFLDERAREKKLRQRRERQRFFRRMRSFFFGIVGAVFGLGLNYVGSMIWDQWPVHLDSSHHEQACTPNSSSSVAERDVSSVAHDVQERIGEKYSDVTAWVAPKVSNFQDDIKGIFTPRRNEKEDDNNNDS